MWDNVSNAGSVCLLSLAVLCTPQVQAAEKDELASAKRLIEQVQIVLERARIAEQSADNTQSPRYTFDYQDRELQLVIDEGHITTNPLLSPHDQSCEDVA
ncbi:RAQPRD family integrative conjugative element protein [Xenorhabdus griffiniae]|uniref:RAQPRD family integrative conjugative element protein n=1 Tax=Xenorhabdus griffiniae TaxID=351672 RepID=A0ABY9XEZ3_9GAMM|nr:RAQPRD family integrative conjugative element protein [Xenorhabdus griffiniae]MBD1229561.1 hypothetical protein [Xenorhabdus griffiniae]MBE8588246.1 hypothetical protein [Xenorhabdus griffiniae]WMV71486.1 RAQPRD family integrative conjugative element protein [Xenorhabdus griffiniae]WNH01163.1 RAQPRD family integrative conjugative element protein [Xenorhabdus griffiniae]